MGVVDVKENPQLRTYALGALLANPGLDVERITVTIVQPRAPHKDGRIRSETFHVADLLEWTADLLAGHAPVEGGFRQLPRAGAEPALDEWADKWLNPGKCKFCPAEGFCPKLKKRALSMSRVSGLTPSTSRSCRNRPDEGRPSRSPRTSTCSTMLEDWIKARRAYAHTLAEQGVEIPNYVLVDKIGNRKWAAEDDKPADPAARRRRPDGRRDLREADPLRRADRKVLGQRPKT
jgi:hypothetical protein